MGEGWKRFWLIFALGALISGVSTFLTMRNVGKSMEQQQEMKEAMKNRRTNKSNRQP